MAREAAKTEFPTAPGRYGYGGCLWLQVRHAENRSWLFRYRRNGRSHEMGLGTLDALPFKEATKEAARWREVLQRGGDPLEERKRIAAEAEERRAREETLEVLSERLISNWEKEERWDSPRTSAQWRSSLKAYAHPKIGKKLPEDVTVGDVVAVLKPIWKRIPTTAGRVRGRLEEILEYGHAERQLREADNPVKADWATPASDWVNPAHWGVRLKILLGELPRSDKHWPAVAWVQMGPFMEHLRSVQGVSARALEFAVLTVSRSRAVRKSTWDEIDFEERTWTVTEDNMKVKKPFKIPLSEPALALLRRQLESRADGSGWIFPSPRKGTPLSDMALSEVLRGMNHQENGRPRYPDPDSGKGAVPHGTARSSFADWARDATDFPDDLIETALAHKIKNKVKAAYRRGDAFEMRRLLMDQWAAFLARGQRPWTPAELPFQTATNSRNSAEESMLVRLLQQVLRRPDSGSILAGVVNANDARGILGSVEIST